MGCCYLLYNLKCRETFLRTTFTCCCFYIQSNKRKILVQCGDVRSTSLEEADRLLHRKLHAQRYVIVFGLTSISKNIATQKNV